MDRASLVYIFDACQHLKEHLDSARSLEVSRMTLLIGGQVLALEVHHYEVLLSCFLLINEVMHLDYPFIIDQFS